MPTRSNTGRPLRRDAQANREAIIEAAVRLIQQHPDAGLEAIALEAGLSRRAVYGHFATREELLEEVFERGAARVTAAILPVDEPDARVAVAVIGSRLWSEVAHIRANASLALREPFAARTAVVLAPVRTRLLELVSDGAAEGLFRSDIDPVLLTRLIESAALAVLDEASRSALSFEEGDRLVMLNTLACAGVDWRTAGELVSAIIDRKN